MLLNETVTVKEVAKRFHTAEIRTPIYRFRTLLSQPLCLLFFFKEKLHQFWTEQKLKKDFWVNRLSCILRMRRKKIDFENKATDMTILTPKNKIRNNKKDTVTIKNERSLK